MPLFSTPPSPWVIPNDEMITQAASTTLTANTVYLYLVEIAGPAAVAQMRYRMGATVTGTVDLGIYDAGGNLLAHTGTTNTVASGLYTLNLLTGVALSAGRYMLALCPSNSTDTYIGGTGFKTGAGRFCVATNAGTAGVLPPTTGTLLATTISPNILAVVIGGAP